MRRNQGREVIDRLLAGGELQRVPASRDHADRLVRQARTHLASAAEISETDPAGGYTLVYDAARKALTAVLENQGLRPTGTTWNTRLPMPLRSRRRTSATTPPRLPPWLTSVNANSTRCRRSDQVPAADIPSKTKIMGEQP